MKPASGICWFVETQGVTLTSRAGRVRLSIPYPHAGLWALIANGCHSPKRAVELVSILMTVDADTASHEVEKTLEVWRQMGIITGE